MTALLLIISYCKAEANMAFRAMIPMVAVCVEDGYEADYWLAVVISAAPGLDCCTDERLDRSLGRLEKELRAAHRVIQYRAFIGSCYCRRPHDEREA